VTGLGRDQLVGAEVVVGGSVEVDQPLLPELHHRDGGDGSYCQAAAYWVAGQAMRSFGMGVAVEAAVEDGRRAGYRCVLLGPVVCSRRSFFMYSTIASTSRASQNWLHGTQKLSSRPLLPYSLRHSIIGS